VVESVTENGTEVAIVPSHCVWSFEDGDRHVHVGLLCVLPSSVGLTTVQLDARVNDQGNVLQVHMYRPKPFLNMMYQHTACKWEGMSQGFIQYCLEGQNKQLGKLLSSVKLG
jgi:hypothetical protein